MGRLQGNSLNNSKLPFFRRCMPDPQMADRMNQPSDDSDEGIETDAACSHHSQTEVSFVQAQRLRSLKGSKKSMQVRLYACYNCVSQVTRHLGIACTYSLPCSPDGNCSCQLKREPQGARRGQVRTVSCLLGCLLHTANTQSALLQLDVRSPSPYMPLG